MGVLPAHPIIVFLHHTMLKRMEKLFYLTLLALLPLLTFAQRKHCVFEPDSRQLEIMKGYQEAIERFGQHARPELRAPIRVPVRLVVFSSRTTSPSPTQADFERALLALNKTFQAANLEFFACESLRRVISSRYADFDSDLDEDNVWNTYGRSGIINIFCFEDIDFGSALGYTYLPSQNGPEALFLLQEELLTSTLPHEMGHYYGLYHTHGKSNCGTTDELVNDPNCGRTGDDVCDTPADPNLLGLFCRESLVDSATCKYIGKELDRIGTPFQPDPSNIMAYTWEHCTTRFTPGQYERMRFFAENVRLYVEDCSGRKICPIPQVVASQLSPGLMQFDWSAGSASVFQARYRLGEDSTWIPLKTIYGNKWLAYDLGACTRVEFQVRAQCEDAYTDWSAPILAFTKGCANNDGYCTSTGGSENVWINQLSLGEWSNKTGDDGGYDLFTPNDLSITAGKTYTLALQPGGFTRARDTLYWRVWVDFNRDKDFNDPGEQVFQAKSRGRSTIVQGSLAFPDSLAGTYRMRLGLSRGGYVDACGKGGIVLETEDYEWAITTLAAGFVEPDLQLNPLGLAAKSSTPQFRILPNPNAGLFVLQAPNTLQGEGQVLVFNSTGKQVHQAKLNFSTGLPAEVRLSDQAPGVYFLRLQVGPAVFSERLILLHH